MVIREEISQNEGGAAGDGENNEGAEGDRSDVPDILRPGRAPYRGAAGADGNAGRATAAAAAQPHTSAGGPAAPARRPQATTADPTDVPSVLQPGGGSSGGASGGPIETNPFKKKLTAADTIAANLASSPQPPTDRFAQLSTDDPTKNPWQQPPVVGYSSQPTTTVPAPTPAPTPAHGHLFVFADAVAAGGAGETDAPSQGVWALHSPSGQQIPRKPSPSVHIPQNTETDLLRFSPDDGGDNAAWNEVAKPPMEAPAAPSKPPYRPLDENDPNNKSDQAVFFEEKHAWDDLSGGGDGAGIGGRPLQGDLSAEATGEGWSLVDDQAAPAPLSRQSTWENFTDEEGNDDGKKKKEGAKGNAKGKGPDAAEPTVNAPEILIAIEAEPETKQVTSTGGATNETDKKKPDSLHEGESGPRPPLPPRSMLDIGDEPPPPEQPPRPATDKTETYQIKNITWHDVRAARNPRVSPILLQNANGPCPLVALVNALTLTTPADSTTALVDTLRSREQVSLALLLDAVFDELMSSRRTSDERELPDVDELYKFLKGLHTGMNVNPRFIPTPEVVKAFRRTSLVHLHPTERDDAIPGTFEDTREMQLYATFNIPLIHGWLPAPADADAAYGALSRRAASYEDVQNLLFREEELEEKLSIPGGGGGLTDEEQSLYQDILEIKGFLHVFATQLTPFGLDVITKAMMPGSVAILFRNDHFSTLYRHPQTLQLLLLVTDAGYASHDEVIWESLVDVNGEHTEFFSGDFRLVGGATQHQLQQGQGQGRGQDQGAYGGAVGSASGMGGGDHQGGGDWTTVRGKRNKHGQGGHSISGSSSASKHEQEDRDLALALQLQEEEEERHRSAEERRNRESRLSEQFIEQQARQPQATNFHSGHRPSNAAGGGRYSSSSSSRSGQQVPVSPRRSSANYYSGGNGLLGSGDSVRRGSSSTVNSVLNSNSNNGQGQSPGRHRGRTPSASSFSQPQQQQPPLQPPRPQQQQQQAVRSLVPPPSNVVGLLNTRPAVNRTADVDDGEEAPPSYEQAAKQAPYHPPAGVPEALGAAAVGVGGSASGSASASSASMGNTPSQPLQPPRRSPMPSAGNGRPYGGGRAGVYGQPPLMRPPQQQQAVSSRDRDCVVM
ncbi:hypothetical protein SPI_08049 [Niveomyces insectorum RCEF 264]|uniref:MINDY deubiquitinase domain-containing protein n=1 Tax=Niveomyces insectorum RCEF 264 TaxID=1081102 RepID=A0A167NRP4_9HYPO|nr:hypothetical protein SPI_08049 [Niveomyces insectorum RCEF 264]